MTHCSRPLIMFQIFHAHDKGSHRVFFWKHTFRGVRDSVDPRSETGFEFHSDAGLPNCSSWQQLTAEWWIIAPWWEHFVCSLQDPVWSFDKQQKALGFGPKFGFPLKWNISERMLSLGGEIYQPSAEFRKIFLRSIDFLTVVNTKPWLLD